ncbi:MAG TPA: patatin-like phospholipase family protein, partial [Saprospiraceae bacterium]|nr:patatin-like phospholipase family protein [Saprospiraceae bacterium]
INAAYVCDTLATLQKRAADQDPTLHKIVESLQQEAKDIRQRVVEYCTGAEAYYQNRLVGDRRKGGYWFYATWSEALMGLSKEQCAAALEKMKTALDYAHDPAKTSVTPSWHRESSAQQIANWIQEDHFGGDEEYRSRAEDLLKTVIGGRTYGSRSQRIGLGLSGGGFRASIFHIGVLARLAEEDLLHNVEVISCVSGGSILGAYYYLKVRNLLQSKPDSQITKADYIQIVREMERDFVSDISYDLRSHIFGGFGTNLKMGCNPSFSRTSRLADLYEKHLYAKLLDKKAEAQTAADRAKKQAAAAAPGTPADKKEGEGEKPDVDATIYMQDLLIAPMGEDGNPLPVSPKRVNWLRKNKIPILVLNATTLNTGHCWQFTATWMGEPPGYINSETDALPTLRRTYYDDAPAPHNKIRLATAVGASSCVPGLFRPVELRDLYQQHSGKLIDVQLVDGGVYDNQGINTLVEQECNVLIISDASGQLASVDDPGAGALQVGGRTNEILQGRIRACELGELTARFNSQLVRGYLLMHLTKGLPSEVVNWRQCDDPYEPNVYDDNRHGDDVLTCYEVRKNIQTALARVRTDLDSFHEQESAMLMYSGYLMTDFELKAGKGWGQPKNNPINFATGLPPTQFKKEEWAFERIKTLHDHPDTSEHLLKTLNTSAGMVKIFSASALVRGIGLLLLAGLVGWLGWRYWPGWVPVLSGIGTLVLAYVAYDQVVVKRRYN